MKYNIPNNSTKKCRDASEVIRSGSYCETEFSIEDAESFIEELGKANNEGDKERALEWGTQEHTNFYFEMVPLLKIAKNKSDTNKDIKILFSGPKQNLYDGIIMINNTKNKVQCVSAVDGYQESLRREYLSQDDVRFVKGMGDVEYTGSKHNRRFKDNSAPTAVQIEGEDWNNDHKKIISTALEKKLNEKYTGYWLSVAIDDSHYFNLNENTERLKRLIDDIIKEKKNNIFRIFPKIFFTGMRTELFLEYD